MRKPTLCPSPPQRPAIAAHCSARFWRALISVSGSASMAFGRRTVTGARSDPSESVSDDGALLHEPAVADDDGLAGERVGTERREEQRGFRHVVHRGEFAIHGLLEHDVLDHLLLGDTEFPGLLGNL